jgi:hypothetical protein
MAACQAIVAMAFGEMWMLPIGVVSPFVIIHLIFVHTTCFILMVTIDTHGYRQPNYRRFQQDLYRKVAVDPHSALAIGLVMWYYSAAQEAGLSTIHD